MTREEREALLESQCSLRKEFWSMVGAVVTVTLLIVGCYGWEILAYLNAAPSNSIRGFWIQFLGLG